MESCEKQSKWYNKRIYRLLVFIRARVYGKNQNKICKYSDPWPCPLQAPWSVQTRRHSWPMQVLNPPVCPTWRTQLRSPRPRGGACSQHGICGLYGLCGLRGLHSLSPLQLQLLPSPPAKTNKQTSPLPAKTNKLTKLQQRGL